ncbi:MAG: YjjG family noncanonical pyrimidine nucleotidase [Melioribacteraceae bacterium]|nr:YjjG family noncanonical pyrimidine nucleotidase [Melioribacteraceae bacterium]MCF8355313.1 YjjG family noncanonical pyrimidine nucleotidase [Melioribacteraceae bacterium]MCF8395698.1 YjjG family noncanonical pyrimidine nucleotidase [Melioribacteraceae bacterium]MCF8420391.1 YjjG family noncanonical pyrimidine nucleotidase [Melioribacteraceae bacterium]
MKYKIALFDADGTLFDYDKAQKSAMFNAFEDFEIQYDETFHLKVFGKINHLIWKEFEKGNIQAEDINIVRFEQFVDDLGLDVNPKNFGDYYLQKLSEKQFLLDGAENLLSSLSGRINISILTNGLQIVQRNRIGNSILSKYFSELFISEEIGYQKPKKEIFEYALSALNHKTKNDVIMIGDNLESDILGGNNFGIDTCWYNPGRLENLTGIHPVYEVDSLDKIYHIVIS